MCVGSNGAVPFVNSFVGNDAHGWYDSQLVQQHILLGLSKDLDCVELHHPIKFFVIGFVSDRRLQFF
jgi:hypothetical protein